jgi:hypothetical protein
MAIKVKNYELPNGQILQDAYLRVQSVYVENKDYEFFKKSTQEGIDEELTWITRLETKASVFVWADELARKNRAIASHWFTIEIDYQLSENENVFEQAYRKLNKIFQNSENV